MTTPTDTSETPADTDTLPAFGEALQQWTDALRVMLARIFNIAVLETRLAALSFVTILILGVASGLLLASAWIALFAAIVAWFHVLGLTWPIALLLMAVINLALAAGGCYAIYRMSNNLLFRALHKFILATEIDDGEPAADAVRQKQSAQSN